MRGWSDCQAYHMIEYVSEYQPRCAALRLVYLCAQTNAVCGMPTWQTNHKSCLAFMTWFLHNIWSRLNTNIPHKGKIQHYATHPYMVWIFTTWMSEGCTGPNTIFHRINALGAEAENEPLPSTDFDESRYGICYLQVLKIWFRLVN